MSFLKYNIYKLMGVPAEDMGKRFKGGSKKQETTQVSTPYQQKDYDRLLQGAGSWLSQGGFDKDYGGATDFNPVAGMNQGQQAGIAGSYQTGQNLQEMYNQQGGQSLGNFFGAYDPNKTGLNEAMGAVNNQMDWNYNTNTAQTIRDGATGAGQYGSTRHGVAEGIAQSQLSQQKMNANSQMAFQDQQQFNQNQLSMLGNLSSITKGLNSGAGLQYDAGSLEQQQQQNEINGQLQKWMYENNASLNDLLAYKQLISGDMGGKGVTTSKGGDGGGSGWGSVATLGGAALGGMFGGTAGASLGASLGSSAASGLS